MNWQKSLGYAIGDLGINLFFISSMTFLLYFYTDVLQISAAAAAGVLLVARLVDAVTDPIMGAIAERTRTSVGAAAPYLLLGSIPLGVVAVLTFTVPDLDESGRVVWAYVTYIAFGILYTVVTIPYSALTASLTDDYEVRTVIDLAYGLRLCWSRGCNRWGPRTGTLFATQAQGYQAVMTLFAAVATLLLAVSFYSSEEVVQPPAQQQLSWRDSLQAVFANGPSGHRNRLVYSGYVELYRQTDHCDLLLYL